LFLKVFTFFFLKFQSVVSGIAPPLKPLDPPAELPAGAKLHPRELAKAFAKTKKNFVRFIVVDSCSCS
jgi:hypothetical protein